METPWQLLARHCGGARKLVIAAPYIKEEALSLLLAVASSAASITCVTRWVPNDIVVGASDLSCRNVVADRGGRFLLHTSLHAKYYR